MRFVIITGMSGAGKTQVMHFMEDMGYYCIDNMPLVFLVPFARMCHSGENEFENVAIVADIRGGGALEKIGDSFKVLEAEGLEYEILFLEARESVILRRYKGTRRSHPLSPEGSIEEGIALERERLAFLRGEATHIIDTSRLLTRDLKQIVMDMYGDKSKNNYFKILVESFGFKYGVPRDADLLFDVRFLPTPYYIEELRSHNGTEKCISDFVMSYQQSTEFLDKLLDMLKMLIPHYIDEGKTEIVIGIGCTGGKHRSVTMAEEITRRLKALDYKTVVRHRDISEE